MVIVVVPSASRAAAISLRTLFLAPTTSTSPASRAPPWIRNCSLTGAHDAVRCGRPRAGGRFARLFTAVWQAAVGAVADGVPARRAGAAHERLLPAHEGSDRWTPS